MSWTKQPDGSWLRNDGLLVTQHIDSTTFFVQGPEGWLMESGRVPRRRSWGKAKSAMDKMDLERPVPVASPEAGPDAGLAEQVATVSANPLLAELQVGESRPEEAIGQTRASEPVGYPAGAAAMPISGPRTTGVMHQSDGRDYEAQAATSSATGGEGPGSRDSLERQTHGGNPATMVQLHLEDADRTGPVGATAPDHWETDFASRVYHASHIGMFSRCGMQVFYRYVEGLRAPPGIGAHRGTAVDRSVNANMEHKRETGELLPVEECQDIAADVFRARLEEGWMASKDEDPKVVEGRALDEAVRSARLHHAEMAPKIQPLHVQRTLKVHIPGKAFAFTGTLDIEEADSVRDTKTTSKLYGEARAHGSIQLTMYSLLRRVTDGSPPGRVALDVLAVTDKTERAVTLASTRAEEQWRSLIERASRMDTMIQAGHFPPADPDSWVCSAAWCGYFDRCPHGRRARGQ